YFVEAAGQLADFARTALLEAKREVARREQARTVGRLAHQPRDRARQVEPEEEDEDRRSCEPRNAQLDRVPGLRIGGSLVARREHVLLGEEVLELVLDLVDAERAFLLGRVAGGTQVVLRHPEDRLHVLGE